MTNIQEGARINTALIAEYLKANNLSKSKFCKQCRIGTSTFEKFLSGNLEIKLVSIFKIATTMGVSMQDLLK